MELARGGVEALDPNIRQRYEEFKVDVTNQALKILRERIPVKILHFNEQVVSFFATYVLCEIIIIIWRVDFIIFLCDYYSW